MAEQRAEIVIVRRQSEEDYAHHGGAWKIALADFMTTLMALFLVLWLIRAMNEETKTSIANYFNPISLSEAMPVRKGLTDPQPAAFEPAEGRKAGDAEASRSPRDAGGTLPPGSAARERELFQDPYAVLARLAAEAEPGKPQSVTVGDMGEPGRRGGDAARDPFDPLYWQVTTLSPAKTDQPAPSGITPPPDRTRPDARGTAAPLRKATETGESRAGETKAAEPHGGDAKIAEAPVAGSRAGPVSTATPDSQAALTAEIASIFPPSTQSAPGPHVDVQGTTEGLLISLTDDLNFSMFAVGSAEPRPEIVRALARLAKVLSTRPGRIIIRGHTDSRPFHSEAYDNWRLSTARAHMASYMLTRAGLDEGRIWRVEGAADRTLRNAADPKAPENRRIEILLQGASG